MYGSLPLVKSILRDAARQTGLEIHQIRAAKSKYHYSVTVDMVTNPDYSDFTREHMNIRSNQEDYMGNYQDLCELFNQMVIRANCMLHAQGHNSSVYYKSGNHNTLKIKARADITT